MAKVNPYDKARELAEAITASDVYLTYINAKKEVEQDTNSREKILTIREKQLELNRAQVLGEEPSPELVQSLAVEFAQINQVSAIASFFDAESHFMQMYNEIQEILQNTLAKDLD